MIRNVILMLTIPLVIYGCATTEQQQHQPRPLPPQVEETVDRFFAELARQGVKAQSYYTLFVPQGTVNVRHLLKFKNALERGLHKTGERYSVYYNASADRVFFLSRHQAAGWKTPSEESGAVLAREFQNGTRAGWTILHSFWSQYNRLLVGDDRWIQQLPDSVRADLSHPLHYVLRVTVALESNPSITSYHHSIGFDFVEVGKERVFYSTRYPLILTYPLP